jgi:NADH-quinone oxidoreductase subunit K
MELTTTMPLALLDNTVIGLTHYLALGAFVFACGLLTIALKRNAIAILMGVELILNAANINLVAFNRYAHEADPAGKVMLDGQIFALFIMVLAAAVAAVALAIFVNYYNNFSTIDVERARELKG